MSELIRMEGIDKAFPGVQALSQCRFELHSGEVHALVGENGAGKSTMMKILTGVYTKDAGSIFLKGKEIEVKNPRSAQEMGINIIHQELNLCQHLTVAQNIFIGRESRVGKSFFLNDKENEKKAKEILDMMNININPKAKVASLTVARQQMVEIAKALSFNADVLIMDEPTAALSDSEIVELFRIINDLRAKGVGIVYISHRMDELKQISDRITVMRDGTYIDTVKTKEVEIKQIISMMVGREIYVEGHAKETDKSKPIVLEVKNLKSGRHIKDVSFELHQGEILGFAGLMGAGRTEVARAIFGADKFESGEILINGKKVDIKSPRDAVQHGVGYLSEDRKRYGVALGLDIATNTVLASLPNFTNKIGWIDEPAIQKQTTKMVDAMSTKTPSNRQRVKNLSGGNQQKVIIGKWLTRDCDILIFDEPTRGIDVGAKGEIYKLLNELADSGKSIIMISSELPEILRMSHRVCVMCEGRLTGILAAKEATQESIMHFATMRESVAKVTSEENNQGEAI